MVLKIAICVLVFGCVALGVYLFLEKVFGDDKTHD